MGTSQVPLVLKSTYKYGKGTVSLQIRRVSAGIQRVSAGIRRVSAGIRRIPVGHAREALLSKVKQNQGYLWSSHDLQKILKV